MPAMDLEIEAKQKARDLTQLEYDGVPILIPHDDSMLVGSGVIDLIIKPSSTRGSQGIFAKDGHGYLTGGHIALEMRNGQIRARIQSVKKSYWLDSGDFRAMEGEETRLRFAPRRDAGCW